MTRADSFAPGISRTRSMVRQAAWYLPNGASPAMSSVSLGQSLQKRARSSSLEAIQEHGYTAT